MSYRRAALLHRLGIALGVVLCVGSGLAEGGGGSAWVHRLEPLGGQRGSIVDLKIVGERLTGAQQVEFDSPDVVWIETTEAAEDTLSGRVRVSRDAALGPHIATVVTSAGRSNARLFYVDQFPSVNEVEPNNIRGQAQSITLRPQTIQGAMHELVDVDFFAFEANAGERWTFDLRSIEYGGFLECDMTLLDAEGRQAAFSDDKDDYLETPFLEHVFTTSGRYLIKLDQYRGPQRVNCAKNCGYMLRVSQLPLVKAAFPLGARKGSEVLVSLTGRSLETVERVYMTRVRGGEYYRLTFPFTIPLHAQPDPRGQALPRIEGNVMRSVVHKAAARFSIPVDASPGLWRLWVEGPHGADDRISFEISDLPELGEDEARQSNAISPEVIVNGRLSQVEEEDVYWIKTLAGQPLVISTLAVQMGLPYIDTVLELFTESGKLLAEGDDLMTGQGTVIGNPDSFIGYAPEKDGRVKLIVRDRIGRGGPSYVYRLKIESRRPGFSLLTDPENINLHSGAETKMGVLLIREPGFDDGVEVWAEGLPEGVTASRETFRADQFFGPSADGDNVIIPEVFLRLNSSAEIAPGDYPIRVFGKSSHGAQTVEAFSTLWIGPPRKRNDVRRPMPQVLLTILDGSARATHGEDRVAAKSRP